jgi:hypothetical protein
MRPLCLAATCLFVVTSASAQTPTQPQTPPRPCPTRAESRQFDFWIGDWEVTPWQQPPGPNMRVLGTSHVEPLLEECLIMENWTGAGGSSGKSMNFWDVNRKKWRQVWIADIGGSLDYEGEFRDGAMRFEGWTAGASGGRVLQRLTFFPISRDTVRQLFATSADSGRTWQPGFDGRYVRRRRP